MSEKDDTARIEFTALADIRQWKDNPKHHDLEALTASIRMHGFKDPPCHDEALGALAYGNGRVTALRKMKEAGEAPPRGVVDRDGEWYVPVVYGVDASDRSAAAAFAIDHNNLTLMGSGLKFVDILQIWDEAGLADVLASMTDAADLLASMQPHELDSLLDGPDFELEDGEGQPALDEFKLTTCPECGHEFKP